MIWRKQGTSLDRHLSLNDVMFACPLLRDRSKGEFMSAWIVGFQSSLAPSSLLSSKRSLLHWILCIFVNNFFLTFWWSNSKLPKNACISLLNMQPCLFGRGKTGSSGLETYENNFENKFQSLVSYPSLLSSKGFLCPCTPSNFLYRLSWKFW